MDAKPYWIAETAAKRERSRSACVIAAASGLGAPDRRCGEGPEHLVAGGLVDRLGARGIVVGAHSTLYPRRGPGRRGSVIAEFCTRLADEVAESMRNGQLPVVLGGDHSCAIGTWTGVARAAGDVGLV